MPFETPTTKDEEPGREDVEKELRDQGIEIVPDPESEKEKEE